MRTIDINEALDVVWSEIVYMRARLLWAEEAKDLAPLVEAQLVRWGQVKAGQYKVWETEIVAQAHVDAEDDNLDDTTEDIGDGLLDATDKDRDSPRFRRYFTKSPSVVTRLGLESQLAVVRLWVPSLKSEPEKALQDLGNELEGDVKRGDAAVAERAGAAAGTADHRVREIIRFVEDVNGLRRSIFGELMQRAVAKKLGRDWPERFFRRSTNGAARGKKKEGGEGGSGGGVGGGEGGGGAPA